MKVPRFHLALWLCACALLCACVSTPESAQTSCSDDGDCAAGYTCHNGMCAEFTDTLGISCAREADCRSGQTCSLVQRLPGSTGPSASCQVELAGAGTGSVCALDADCRTGLCALGRCSELCAAPTDCPKPTGCVGIPHADGLPLYRGCLQANGILDLTLPADTPRATFHVPVPDHALSMTLLVRVRDRSELAGIVSLKDPSGVSLYTRPTKDLDYYSQPLRYAPDYEVSSLRVPSSSAVKLVPGLYEGAFSSLRPSGNPGNQVPEIHVQYRLGQEGKSLHVNLYFLNLLGHACLDAPMNAAAAEASPAIQGEFLPALRQALLGADITVGSISYRDLEKRPDLDTVSADELPELYAQSRGGMAAVNVFLVRSVQPAGVLGLSGGTPGPMFHGTAHSGVVLSADSLCFQSWTQLGRTAAHESAHYLGLFHNVEHDGHRDPLDDSNLSTSNLMYFGLSDDSELSSEQGAILRTSPVLR
jgi:hypothetical protein